MPCISSPRRSRSLYKTVCGAPAYLYTLDTIKASLLKFPLYCLKKALLALVIRTASPFLCLWRLCATSLRCRSCPDAEKPTRSLYLYLRLWVSAPLEHCVVSDCSCRLLCLKIFACFADKVYISDLCNKTSATFR